MDMKRPTCLFYRHFMSAAMFDNAMTNNQFTDQQTVHSSDVALYTVTLRDKKPVAMVTPLTQTVENHGLMMTMIH